MIIIISGATHTGKTVLADRLLKKYHYQGDFSWEFVHDRVPDAVYGEYLKFINASGNYLLNL